MAIALALIGPPGAPVAELAALLAGRRGMPWCASDDEIARQAGRPVEDLLIDEGETVFRDLERDVVARLLADFDGILALGGGVLSSQANQLVLHGVPLVFVDTTITEAARRLGLNLIRTTTIVNPRAQWLRMLEQRRPVYERFATATVLADGRPLADLADELAEVW